MPVIYRFAQYTVRFEIDEHVDIYRAENQGAGRTHKAPACEYDVAGKVCDLLPRQVETQDYDAMAMLNSPR